MNKHRMAFLIALCLAPSSLAAQGFDCGKAQTPIEKLICAAPEIGVLDKELNAAVQARLTAAPLDRETFLADARQWLRLRNKTCVVPAGALSAQQRNAAVACLANVYRARLTAIAAMPPAQNMNTDAGKALCRRFVDAYRATLAARVNDPKDANAPLSQPPFALLANTPNSGVTRAPEAQRLQETNARQLDQWARNQTPPLRFSPRVRHDILELGSTAITTIERAPATDFYVVTQVQGTAHCIYSASFVIKNGVAERAAKPLWSDQPGDSCGVDRFFGDIDGRTVAVEDNESPYDPSLASGLTLKAWDKQGFGPSCSIAFDYDPAFVDTTSEPAQEPDQKCDSAACVALKPAAMALVEAVQRDPLAARRNAVAALSATQRTMFETMAKQAQDNRGEVQPPEAPENPASYLDQNPLLLPLLHQGEVYLASIGHYTIGWRIFPDWSVKLEKGGKDDKNDKGALQTVGVAFVAMRRGALRAATVQ